MKYLILLAALSSPVLAQLGQGNPNRDVFWHHYGLDPVNIRTGNFYLPAPDYHQSCWGFDFELTRFYNSFSKRTTSFGSLGKGWSTNFDVELLEDPNTGIIIIESDGFLNKFEPIENKENLDKSRLIDRLVSTQLKTDATNRGNKEGQGFAYYKEYRKRLENDKAFLEKEKSRQLGTTTSVSPSGKYYSQQRGYSELTKQQNGFLRVHENGIRETFDKLGRLVRAEDRHQNDYTISYDALSRRSLVRNSCQQSLQFSYSKMGLLEKVMDNQQLSVVYAYDAKGRLQYVTSMDGKVTEYVYNAKDAVIGIKFSPKEIVSIEYDLKTSRVLSQTGPGKLQTKYEYKKNSATEITSVKSSDGENTRYEFNDGTHTMTVIDKNGNKSITTFSSCCGQTISVTDEKGVGDHFEYDGKGRLVKIINAQKQTSELKYDPRSEADFTFSLPISIKDFDGTTKTYNYDSKGDVNFAKSSVGTFVKIEYEPHGEVKKIVDHKNRSLEFFYELGRPTKLVLRDKGSEATLVIDYDKLGSVSNVEANPALPSTKETIVIAMQDLFSILKPLGLDFSL